MCLFSLECYEAVEGASCIYLESEFKYVRRPSSEAASFCSVPLTMDVFLLVLQKLKKHQVGLEVVLEVKPGAEQAAAGAAMPLTLTFQKSSQCAQTCQKLFIPQSDQHPDRILGPPRESLPKFQLLKNDCWSEN